MDISLTCSCGTQQKAPAALAGKRVRCEDCGRWVPVPHPLPEFADLGLNLEGGEPVAKETEDPVVAWLARIAGVEPSSEQQPDSRDP